MKRIEDAPKELQKVFWDYFEEEFSDYDCSTDVMAHLFLKGFDTAMATGKLTQRPKRSIVHITEMGSHIYALSTDGKLFRNHWATPQEWQALPELPQDSVKCKKEKKQ